MPKLQEHAGKGGGFFIWIPKTLANQRGWKKGQELDLRFNERGNIEIFEVK